MEKIFYIVLISSLFGFISWSKYKKHKTPNKQWEGEIHDKRSPKELRLEQNKYRGI